MMIMHLNHEPSLKSHLRSQLISTIERDKIISKIGTTQHNVKGHCL